MSESVSRTFIGSVVCVDLVGYSTRSVAQQIAIKDVFNRLLGQALERVPEEDRIILDTGDGAAISFLGDPEQSLAVGLAVRDAMHANAAALGAANGAEDAVRMGINLGPVKLAVDMNGYPKIIGDGLNVAERIMGFAKPGQIAVSRSFVEMVSRLSDANTKLFRLEGMRTDKNAREHQVYVVDPAAGRAPVGKRAAGSADGEAGALVGFLENKLMVGSAAVVLLAMILGESALLARKWRSNAPAVATAEPAAALPPKAEPVATKPAQKPVEAPPAKASQPAPQVAAAPAKAPEAREPAKPEKVEPKSEPAKAAAARRDEPAPKPAAEPVSAVPPNLVSIATLNFPSEAAARGISSGNVRARLTIDAGGNVTRVVVVKADPPRFFDEEAVRSLKDWKFDRGPANRQYVADIQFKK